jgi:regulatory protein
VDEAAVDGVLERLRAHALVDDGAFAEYWVAQRQTFKPRGARLVRAELRQHGVDAASANAAAETLTDSAVEDAYRAAYKRATQLAAVDDRTFTTKLSQFLARRGFDWDTITPAVTRLQAERSAAPGSQ